MAVTRQELERRLAVLCDKLEQAKKLIPHDKAITNLSAGAKSYPWVIQLWRNYQQPKFLLLRDRNHIPLATVILNEIEHLATSSGSRIDVCLRIVRIIINTYDYDTIAKIKANGSFMQTLIPFINSYSLVIDDLSIMPDVITALNNHSRDNKHIAIAVWISLLCYQSRTWDQSTFPWHNFTQMLRVFNHEYNLSPFCVEKIRETYHSMVALNPIITTQAIYGEISKLLNDLRIKKLNLNEKISYVKEKTKHDKKYKLDILTFISGLDVEDMFKLIDLIFNKKLTFKGKLSSHEMFTLIFNYVDELIITTEDNARFIKYNKCIINTICSAAYPETGISPWFYQPMLHALSTSSNPRHARWLQSLLIDPITEGTQKLTNASNSQSKTMLPTSSSRVSAPMSSSCTSVTASESTASPSEPHLVSYYAFYQHVYRTMNNHDLFMKLLPTFTRYAHDDIATAHRLFSAMPNLALNKTLSFVFRHLTHAEAFLGIINVFHEHSLFSFSRINLDPVLYSVLHTAISYPNTLERLEQVIQAELLETPIFTYVLNHLHKTTFINYLLFLKSIGFDSFQEEFLLTNHIPLELFNQLESLGCFSLGMHGFFVRYIKNKINNKEDPIIAPNNMSVFQLLHSLKALDEYDIFCSVIEGKINLFMVGFYHKNKKLTIGVLKQLAVMHNIFAMDYWNNEFLPKFDGKYLSKFNFVSIVAMLKKQNPRLSMIQLLDHFRNQYQRFINPEASTLNRLGVRDHDLNPQQSVHSQGLDVTAVASARILFQRYQTIPPDVRTARIEAYERYLDNVSQSDLQTYSKEVNDKVIPTAKAFFALVIKKQFETHERESADYLWIEDNKVFDDISNRQVFSMLICLAFENEGENKLTDEGVGLADAFARLAILSYQAKRNYNLDSHPDQLVDNGKADNRSCPSGGFHIMLYEMKSIFKGIQLSVQTHKLAYKYLRPLLNTELEKYLRQKLAILQTPEDKISLLNQIERLREHGLDADTWEALRPPIESLLRQEFFALYADDVRVRLKDGTIKTGTQQLAELVSDYRSFDIENALNRVELAINNASSSVPAGALASSSNESSSSVNHRLARTSSPNSSQFFADISHENLTVSSDPHHCSNLS